MARLSKFFSFLYGPFFFLWSSVCLFLFGTALQVLFLFSAAVLFLFSTGSLQNPRFCEAVQNFQFCPVSFSFQEKEKSVSAPESGFKSHCNGNPSCFLLPFALSIEGKSCRCTLPVLAGLAQPHNLKGQKVIVAGRHCNNHLNRLSGFGSG